MQEESSRALSLRSHMITKSEAKVLLQLFGTKADLDEIIFLTPF